MKEEVIELWRLCFEDTEEFIRFYFDRKYKDENTLVYRENGRLLSCLQMLPYPMTFAGTEIRASYISGACTHPSIRGKGAMKQLLAEAFGKMLSSGVGVSVLIPQESWLFDYYRKSGYVTSFGYETERYTIRHQIVSDKQAVVLEYDECKAKMSGLYHYFSDRMKKRPCCIQHDFEDFDMIVDDLYVSSGQLVVVVAATGRITGMAFVIPAIENIWVKEWFYDTEQDKKALLQGILQKWEKEEIKCKVPVALSVGKPGGMARIIDAGRMLSLYAACYPDKQFSLKLTDEILTENTGFYQLKEGVCHRREQDYSVPDFSMDMPILTQALLGQHGQLPSSYRIFEPQQAYMNLMLD